MAMFGGASQRRHAGATPVVPAVPGGPPALAPTPGPGAVLGEGTTPPMTAQSGAMATVQAILAARKARKKAAAKPTIVGAASPHPPVPGTFTGRSLLGY